MRTQDSELSASDAALRRGVSAARAGLRTVATAQFERAAETMPDDPNVWLWLAWVGNSPDNMIRCLERVQELSPGHTTAAAGLAWARALAQDASMTPVAIPIAKVVSDSIVPMEIASSEKSPNPETSVTELPVAAFQLVSKTADAVDALENPVEPVRDVTVESPQESRAANPAEETVEVADEPSRATISELPTDFPPLDVPRHWWGDLVQHGSDAPTDVTPWPSPVPPPLPMVTVAANALAEPEPVAPPDVPEIRVTNSMPPTAPPLASGGLMQPTQTDVESLTSSFNPPTRDISADGRPLVMVVDDSPTVRKLVSLTLERRGYRVISAFDGVAAIKELGSCRPDLILLDINMPRLDGYRLCKLIKKHEATQTIPVVMLSGKDGMFDKLRGRLVGCSDYITKPFEADALSQKVAKYLTSTSGAL